MPTIPISTEQNPATPEGIPVPLDSLSQPDDKENMQTPSEGDSVSLQVDATIVSIQGKTAFIKPTSVNGETLEEGEGTPDEESNEENEPVDDLGKQEADLRASMANQNQ